MIIEGSRYVLLTEAHADSFLQMIKARLKISALILSVAQWVPPKTRKQRNYLHLIIGEAADQLRCDPRELKEDLKAQLGCVKVAPSLVSGDRVARIVPTELYSREEMIAFITAITAWAHQKGLLLTAPDEHDMRDSA